MGRYRSACVCACVRARVRSAGLWRVLMARPWLVPLDLGWFGRGVPRLLGWTFQSLLRLDWIGFYFARRIVPIGP
ncbi:hypothetical protein EDB81DRAFT_826913 [Dactylonectria macrodidyma]|uniref:Uncharacterized protein n=1 Tax=Dactylonectria macrodidyma TaxID=307937 RepID=A0A9P9I954_9HYPO|nr:hypothetical protein EDB81DRAFT_826913 [Dactylonectria macrodidyma]